LPRKYNNKEMPKHKEVFTYTVELSVVKSPFVSPPIPSFSGIRKVRKFY
jgi:hypothetical protein